LETHARIEHIDEELAVVCRDGEALVAAKGIFESGSDIRREIARRERFVATLERRKNKLLRRVAALDAQITANGGSNGHARWSGGRTRARNEVNLIDALAETLKGKTMSVTEVAEAVQKNGYKTTSPNFRTMVNAALLNKKRFKRIERGRYTAA
jgi:hypothetical protein